MSNNSAELLKQLESLEKMPTIPVVLAALLRYLERPLDSLELQEVVDLVSQDKSLAAQCLQMANSPLYGRWHTVDSIRSAVVALGLQRMRDIAVSCSLLKLAPSGFADIDPMAFWEHSLGCALVSRQFARRIGFADPGKAYLAGLLHDLGIVAELSVIPTEFENAFQRARSQNIPLHEAEHQSLGITHCDAGKIVAERWHLSSELVAVMGCHHQPDRAPNSRDLVAVVALSDLLCRMCGLGYGYIEEQQVNFMEEPAFNLLLDECSSLKNFDWARFTFELEAYMQEVHRLVAVLYGTSQ
ncbi:MAG TPA: HDOD domain-containing protein [Terriglobales bacterium]|jgi:HD-like signal output (HDOD) protein|nr:HDOD domain-containing protein [Terriglobales bacterium]